MNENEINVLQTGAAFMGGGFALLVAVLGMKSEYRFAIWIAGAVTFTCGAMIVAGQLARFA